MSNDKYIRKKINIKTHKRYDPRIGKKVNVQSYKRDQNFRVYKQIGMNQAREFFEKRSPLQKKIDLKLEANMMFALPNQLWLRNPNMIDIWGIDGYKPPIVEVLPENPFPYQIVRFRNDIWVANENGEFTSPETDLQDIEAYQKPKKPKVKGYSFEKFDSKEKQEEFEKFTNKNAIWNNKITMQYKEWLEQDYQLQKLADKLNPKKTSMKLHELMEFYSNLKISDKKLKRAMFKLYNDKYAQNISSYTKDFQDFYDRRYYDILESKIKAEVNRIKALNKDSKKSKDSKRHYYSKSSINFRLPTIRKMLTSKNYMSISDSEVENMLSAYPKWENQDIVDELIEQYDRGELIDSDIVDLDEMGLRDLEHYEAMKDYYSKKEKDQYLDYLAQKELEDEYREQYPEKYAKLKDSEIETFMDSIHNLPSTSMEV